MSQKAFLKLEKKLACDLRPGDLFVTDIEDTVRFTHSVNGADPMLAIYIRTNAPSEDFVDMDFPVHKVHVTIVDPEEGLPPRINPHAPPGMDNGKG